MKRWVLTAFARTALIRAGVVGLFGVVATLLYLWQHMVMVDLGYRIETARQDLADLAHARAELQLEVASLSSLARVERIARDQLGMVSPKPMQLVRVITVPAPVGRTGEGPMMLAASQTR